jgi:hypothetical protein
LVKELERRLFLGLGGLLMAAPALAASEDEEEPKPWRRRRRQQAEGASEAADPWRYDLDTRLPAARRTVRVDDGEALAAALAEAEPGDHILLKSGDYALEDGFVATRGGTAEAPVVIRPERLGAARLRSPLLLTANHACFYGVDFDTRDALTIEGDRNAMLRCIFRDLTAVTLRSGASYNRIGWNSFKDLPFYPSSERNAIRLEPRGRDPRPMTGNHIYRNYFTTDVGDEKDGRGMLAIYVGLSAKTTLKLPPTRTLIEYNLFDRIDYNSAVRIKTHGNMIRYNTAIGPGRHTRRRNMAQFAQRQGNGNRWHGNWAEDTRGFKINGEGQEFLGNKVVGRASLDLNCGSDRNKDPCSYSLFVANDGKCVVGNRDFREEPTKACKNNWFEEHLPGADAIELAEWQEDTLVSPKTSRTGLPRAVRLEPHEVGAEAEGAPTV